MKYAKNTDNQINIYSQLPRVYNGIINFPNASQEVLEANGFYQLIEPSYDANTQKLDNLHFESENKVFTYNVVDLTEEEIEALQQQKLLEQIEEMNAKFERDGKQYYNEIKQRLTVMLIGKENAMAIMAEIKQSIDPMLNQIKVGNYPFALLDYMDGQNNPTIPEVVDLFNEIGQYVNDYYTNEYPH